MGSYCSIVLFIDVLIYIVKCKDKPNGDGDDHVNHPHSDKQSSNNDIERLVCVYKKPKIKWNDKSISQSNQAEILTKHIIIVE